MPDSNLEEVFDRLKAVLEKHEDELVVVKDEPKNYFLNTNYAAPNKKPLFFGAVKIMSKTVNYYLMPVYIKPELLEGMSPELKKHMQGKSCFNFKKIDEDLFTELAELSKRGLEEINNSYSD